MLLKLQRLLLLSLSFFACATATAVNEKQPAQNALPTVIDLTQSTAAQTPTHPQFSATQQQRLDVLFTRLASSEHEQAAKQLVAEIWSIWKKPLDQTLLSTMTQAEQLFVSGERAQAFALLDQAVQDYPQYSEIWNQRATYYYFDGRYEDSLNDIAEVLALEPRHFGAMSGKIAILMRADRMELALKTLRQALKVNPFMPERHLLAPRPEQQTAPKGLAI